MERQADFGTKCLKTWCGLLTVGLGSLPSGVLAQDSDGGGVWATGSAEEVPDTASEDTSDDIDPVGSEASVESDSMTSEPPDSEEILSSEVPDYDAELLRVEAEVQDLKERVFRSKATLALLREIMIQGSSSGAHATIWHVNRLGA